MKKKQKILITGACGFIGFHTALALSQKNISLIGLDNFSSYYDPTLKQARAKILSCFSIPIITGDIVDQKLLESVLEKEKIDGVIHLAAQAGVRYSFTHPEEYVSSNLIGFVSLMEAIKKHPVQKLVYASSSSVYGLNTKIPFSENDQTDQPANFYGATKKANELIAHSYHHLYGIPMIGLRFFTVYGPFGRPDMAYFSFTKDILEGRPIKIYNHGQMERDFTYIDDIVDGICAALEVDKTFEVYNLGNNHPSSVLELVSRLEKLLKKEAKKELLPMQKGEVLKTYADIDKSVQDLGFSPKVTLSEGLMHFVKWYKFFYQL